MSRVALPLSRQLSCSVVHCMQEHRSQALAVSSSKSRQCCLLTVSIDRQSLVQPSPPSHSSPSSTAPLGHTGLQSLSLLALAPGGQQPSSEATIVMSAYEQVALQLRSLPT